MQYADHAFDAVVDKSLIDCLRCCDDAKDTTQCYLDEAFRVLAPGGVFVVVSFQSEPYLRAALRRTGWDITKMQDVTALVHEAHGKDRTVVHVCACVKKAESDAAENKGCSHTAEFRKKLLKQKSRNERRKDKKIAMRTEMARSTSKSEQSWAD